MCETQQIGRFGSINHRRLRQSMFLSKPWFFFPESKMDCLHILCIVFFRFRKMLLFYICIGFFIDSGRCFLRPKLSILYSMYPIMIIGISPLKYGIIWVLYGLSTTSKWDARLSRETSGNPSLSKAKSGVW